MEFADVVSTSLNHAQAASNQFVQGQTDRAQMQLVSLRNFLNREMPAEGTEQKTEQEIDEPVAEDQPEKSQEEIPEKAAADEVNSDQATNEAPEAGHNRPVEASQ